MAPAPHPRLPLSVALARQRPRGRVPAVGRANRPLLVPALLALAAAACGTMTTPGRDYLDDGADEGGVHPRGEQDLQATDNKIERASQQFFADAPNNKEPPPQEVAEFGKKTVFPAIQDEIDRVEALGAPAGDEEEVKRMLDAASRASPSSRGPEPAREGRCGVVVRGVPEARRGLRPRPVRRRLSRLPSSADLRSTSLPRPVTQRKGLHDVIRIARSAGARRSPPA